MKLAEALAIRKDKQKKIEQLKSRVLNNVRIQEGDIPSENPVELMGEMDACLKDLFALIFKINKTNMNTVSDGRTVTEMMAERDVLSMRAKDSRNLYLSDNQ